MARKIWPRLNAKHTKNLLRTQTLYHRNSCKRFELRTAGEWFLQELQVRGRKGTHTPPTRHMKKEASECLLLRRPLRVTIYWYGQLKPLHLELRLVQMKEGDPQWPLLNLSVWKVSGQSLLPTLKQLQWLSILLANLTGLIYPHIEFRSVSIFPSSRLYSTNACSDLKHSMVN